MVELSVPANRQPAVRAARRRLQQLPQLGQAIVQVHAIFLGAGPVVVQQPASADQGGVGLPDSEIHSHGCCSFFLL
jgi:hypothetical protein